MESESVKVIIRSRPLNDRELNLKCKSVLEITSETGQCTINNPHNNQPPKNFFFDGAYNQLSTTKDIYEENCYTLVEGVLEGYNGTIFAYGQTGCGKSYTMQGIADPASQKGVVSRAFEHIFESISVNENTKYLVHGSFLEIYNEEIRDLLGKDVKCKLELKEIPDSGVYVAGLSKHKITTPKDFHRLLNIGYGHRSTGETLMNSDSSRSHSIFTIYLEMINQTSNQSLIRTGKLNLVDLAGSERQAKTGTSGERLKEATKINLSLSALGNVISALVDSKVKHIPYRDSKLTRLLQDSLGGNTKTLMIACLSPADNNYDETLSTLRYANRAKNIQNKPKINEDQKDTLLRQYQDEIINLKKLLLESKTLSVNTNLNFVTNELNQIDLEKDTLKKEYEEKLRKIEAQYQAELIDKTNLIRSMDDLKLYYNQRISVLESKQTKPNDVSTDTNQSTAKTNLNEQIQAIKSITSGSDQENIANSLQTENLLQRLHSLEAELIGGEQADNIEMRNKQKQRLCYAEERRNRLAKANRLMEDEGIMIGIYDTIQDELRKKNELFNKEKQKVEALQIELKDIQSEFEIDRGDYLETIRRQEKEIGLLNAIIQKIQPGLRRDSNYYNINKIKRMAKYDSDKNEWILPQLIIECTQLPPAQPYHYSEKPPFSEQQQPQQQQQQPFNEQHNYYNELSSSGAAMNDDFGSVLSEESRFYQKLKNRVESQDNYFTNNRAKQLLLEASAPVNSNKCNFKTKFHHQTNNRNSTNPAEKGTHQNLYSSFCYNNRK